MSLLDKKILLTGATGLIGVNLLQALRALGADVTACGNTRGTLRYNLTDPVETACMFDITRPEAVIHLAARVGGIYANVSQAARFYRENTLINTNLIGEIIDRQIPYVLAMGTGCAYSKRLEGQWLFENEYLDGRPEPTNAAYAYAKRNMLAHLQAAAGQVKYSYVIPANIYGPHDNFHPEFSHVVPGLIQKFVRARREGLSQIKIWGDGTARRDFLYIDDLCEALLEILRAEVSGAVNVATGEDVCVAELAEMIAELTGYRGGITYDRGMPAGQQTRMFNIDKIKNIGWRPRRTLREGLRQTIEWYEKNYRGK
jgi:nucleoside-diphosphate-sugar epimerase